MPYSCLVCSVHSYMWYIGLCHYTNKSRCIKPWGIISSMWVPVFFLNILYCRLYIQNATLHVQPAYYTFRGPACPRKSSIIFSLSYIILVLDTQVQCSVFVMIFLFVSQIVNLDNFCNKQTATAVNLLFQKVRLDLCVFHLPYYFIQTCYSH